MSAGEEDKRMLPCRFFSSGFCHKGNRCRFYHPSPSNMSTAIQVPPLPAGFGGPGPAGQPVRPHLTPPARPSNSRQVHNGQAQCRNLAQPGRGPPPNPFSLGMSKFLL